MPAEPSADLIVGVVSLDPDTDLLAFGQGQRLGWHAGLSTGQGLCVDSEQHARHHALTGGTSSLNCSRHPLNSPIVLL
jgi:hypothetical protein